MVDLQTLKTEIQTDPKGLGYSGLAGPADIAAKLNEHGASGETIEPTFIDTIDAAAAVDVTEYAALSLDRRQLWSDILTAGQDRGFPAKHSGIRSLIGDLFTAGNSPITRAALLALQVRSASRAEILFGEGVGVNYFQVSAALLLGS